MWKWSSRQVDTFNVWFTTETNIKHEFKHPNHYKIHKESEIVSSTIHEM